MPGFKYAHLRDSVPLSRVEEKAGWLGREWNDPQNPPPAADRDGHSDLGFALCDCGAEDHEPCRCVERAA